MKIKSLRFKNINNLRGEHSIDFSSEPLASAGLFAITGPTGSGKSSLLDVITLALFNRIPRYNKSLSKNEILNAGSVITHHTKDAAAHITYQVRDTIYTSSWTITTARTGSLKDYEMFIYDEAGEVLDLKKSEVPAYNENIIGLKYDQFIKSILLSQGEFAKFLKADKNERGELLEHITGTSIYRTIGIKAYEKFKQSKIELDNQTILLGEIKTLEPEAIEHLNMEHKQLEEVLKKADYEIKDIENTIRIKKEIQNNNVALNKAKAEKIKIDKAFQSFIPIQKKLDLHQKLTPIQGPLATYNDALKNAEVSQSNLEEYKLDLNNANKSLEDAIKQMHILTKKEITENNFKKVMSDFELEINNMDRDLINIKNKGKEYRTDNEELLKSYPQYFDRKTTPDKAIYELTAEAIELKNKISISDIKTNEDLTKVKSRLKENHKKIELLNDIRNAYETIDTLTKKENVLAAEIKSLKEKNKSLKPIIEKTNDLITKLKENETLLRKQKEDAVKIASLESHRHQLIDGQPCPLCGALSHPYSNDLELQNNKIDSQLKKVLLSLEENTSESSRLSKEYSASNATIIAQMKSLSETQEEIDKNKQHIDLKSSASQLNEKISSDTIPLTIERLNNINKATEAAIDAIQLLSLNSKLINSYKKLNEVSNTYRTLKAERTALYAGENINNETNKLQDQFETNKSRIIELSAVIKKESESLERDQNLVVKIKAELKPKLLNLGFDSIDEISKNILSEDYQLNYTQQKEKLNHDKSSIQTTLTSLIETHVRLSKEDTQPEIDIDILNNKLQTSNEEKSSNEIRKGEINAQLKRDKEDQIKIQDKQKTIQKLKDDYEKWSKLKNLIGDATGSKFSNFAQGLTLKNLLVYANLRLQKLSDRYLLDMPGNDGSLFIIDQYQGNTTRSVNTLSGGESFLISLSLALSLSDMASRNASLKSLFIDEGFGTLDQDTLELAMTTLEKLQSDSQKTVGIISHVEALKERIQVQIKLKKNAQGYSSIEIRS